MTNIMQIFLKVLNLSISASYLIIAIIVARLILKRAPKALYCVLWLLVAIRLVFPFSIESVFSLIPAAQPIPADIIYEDAPHINTGAQIVDTSVNNYLQQNMAPQSEHSANPMQTAIAIASCIWIIGIAVMCAYLVFTTLRLKHKVRDAVPYEIDGDRIYRTDVIGTPFLLGLINPKIYVPYGIDEDTLKYVALHENAHRKRHDHLIKPIAYLLLSVYWFNPVIWIAYCLLCRDIELACDEKVIRRLGADNRCAYSEALLACSVSRKTIAACPIAFGEVGIKARIKNILDYKKPTFWIIVVAVAVCVIIPICFMTQQKNDTTVSDTVTVSELVTTDTLAPAETSTKSADAKSDASNSNQLEKRPVEASTESTDTKSIQQSQIETWAEAFCARNGSVIAEMADENVCAQFGEKELLTQGINDNGDSYVSFGWSSPWPWEQEGSYRIIDLTDSAATILYYAWTSDPHVAVWREELGFETKNDNIVIKSENLEILDAICTSEEFYKAYPDGIITGTTMDYTANGVGESLKNSIMEKELLHPAEAAKNLLNILDNPNKVDATTVYYDDIENSAKVTFTFELDHKSLSVKMIQPYGKDGIWIPQTDTPTGDMFISGVVNTDVIEVRKTPSETAEVIGVLPEGRLVTFEMLSEDGDFYKISTENDGETIQGYVKKEYIDK